MRIEFGARQRFEIDVEKTDVADVDYTRAVLAAPAIDQVNERIADALDRGNVEFARPGHAGVTPRA